MVNKLNRLVPALIMLLAAVIVAGALVWFGLRQPSGPGALGIAPPSTGLSSSTPQGPVSGVPIFHTTVFGKVTAVGNGSITVAASSQSMPGAPQSTSTTPTVVTINSNTAIYKEGALKSQAEFQQEAAAFKQKIQNAGPGVIYVAPDQYTHVALTLSDIAVGDIVSVNPTTDQQAPGDTVTAASIQVVPPPVAQ
jgi:hypothetical protein